MCFVSCFTINRLTHNLRAASTGPVQSKLKPEWELNVWAAFWSRCPAAASSLTDIVHHDALPLLRKCPSWKTEKETHRESIIINQHPHNVAERSAHKHRRLFSPSPGVMVSISTPIFCSSASSRPPNNASGSRRGGLSASGFGAKVRGWAAPPASSSTQRDFSGDEGKHDHGGKRWFQCKKKKKTHMRCHQGRSYISEKLFRPTSDWWCQGAGRHVDFCRGLAVFCLKHLRSGFTSYNLGHCSKPGCLTPVPHLVWLLFICDDCVTDV